MAQHAMNRLVAGFLSTTDAMTRRVVRRYRAALGVVTIIRMGSRRRNGQRDERDESRARNRPRPVAEPRKHQVPSLATGFLAVKKTAGLHSSHVLFASRVPPHHCGRRRGVAVDRSRMARSPRIRRLGCSATVSRAVIR